MTTPHTQKGSFLMELLVAMALISVTLTLVLNIFITSQRSHRYSVAHQDVVRSLTFLLADMTREARVSSNYRCVTAPLGSSNPSFSGCTGSEFGMTRIASINDQGAAEVTYDGATKKIDADAHPMLPPTVELVRMSVEVFDPNQDGQQRAIISLTARSEDEPSVVVTMQTAFTARTGYYE